MKRDFHPHRGVRKQIQQTAIKTATKKSRIERELDEAVEKCKDTGLNKAADFLETKGSHCNKKWRW